MAAPDEITISNLSGKFIMSKTLSDDTDRILELQGVSWFMRKAIKLATITLYISHYNHSNIEHIDIEQTFTGGIPKTIELRTLDWIEREHTDGVFGAVIGKSRRVKVDELDQPWLKQDWTDETVEHGVVQSYVESNTPKSGTSWIANQTWGMEMVNGERRYTRHVKFTGPKKEDIEARLVYDYMGPL